MRFKFVLVSIGILLAAICTYAIGQEHTANYWLQTGNGFYSKGSYELAEKCYEKAIELDSNNISAWYLKGLTLAYLNKYSESIKAFDQAVRLDSKNVDVWINKGNALYVMAKTNETLDKSKEKTEERTEDLGSRNNYTFIKKIEGIVGYKEKWEYIFNISKGTKRIAAILNNTQDISSELALVFEDPHGMASEDNAALGTGNLGPIEVIDPELGHWKVVVYGYNVSSTNTTFHIDLINQSYLPPRYNESLKAYDKAIELDPKSVVALNNKALVLYESHSVNESIELIEKSLKIEPLNPWTWWFKGHIFSNQRRYEDALQYFNNAIDLDPSYAQTWLDKSSTLVMLGRIDEANIASDKWSELLGYKPLIRYSKT